MSRRVEIDTRTIETALNRIQQQLVAMRERYNVMRSNANQTQGMDFRGEAGEVFRNKINSYESNIAAIEDVINQYRAELARFGNNVVQEENRLKGLANTKLAGTRARRG